MSRGRPKKHTGMQVQAALENLPTVNDFKPLLSDKASAVIAAKEAELTDAGRAMQAIERRIFTLEKEIAKSVGEKQAEIKELKKCLSTGKKNTAIRVAEIWTIIQYDTSEIPGTNEYEKKQFITNQQKGRQLAE